MGSSERDAAPKPRVARIINGAELRNHPRRRALIENDAFAVWASDRADGSWLIIDIRPIAGLIGPEGIRLVGGLLELLLFGSAAERDAYVAARLALD